MAFAVETHRSYPAALRCCAQSYLTLLTAVSKRLTRLLENVAGHFAAWKTLFCMISQEPRQAKQAFLASHTNTCMQGCPFFGPLVPSRLLPFQVDVCTL